MRHRKLATCGAGFLAGALCLSVSTVLAGEKQGASGKRGETTFQSAMLDQFDENNNGRLDVKEQTAATRVFEGRPESDTAAMAIRRQALAKFDKNGNGTLDRPEIRTAIASVNKKAMADRIAARRVLAASAAAADSDRLAAATSGTGGGCRGRRASSETKVVQAEMLLTGLDPASAQQLALETFDANGDGALNSSELAAAQNLLSQQIAMARQAMALASQQAISTLPFVSTTTGTTSGTTTGTTGTTSGSSMVGGCSGTTGTTSTGTAGTSSAALRSFGNLGGNGGFGGIAGNGGFGGASFRGFRR
jgi:Ca2+-binding EF-hand superfamily protein